MSRTPRSGNFRLSSLRFGLIAILAVLISAPSAPAAEIVVSPAGPITTIRAALDQAAHGDTVVVLAGTYREGSILITKSISFLGRGWPVLDGEGKHEVLRVAASKVRISGFRIANVGRSFVDDNAGIKLDNADSCIIENNRLEDAFFGIYGAGCTNLIIRGNTLQAVPRREANSGNGIHLWNSKHVRIEGNRITGHRDGIYLEFVEDGSVHGNESWANLRYGLHFMFSHRCEYVRNVFRENGAGVAVMYTRQVKMQWNRFESNRGPVSYGLLLKEITDSRIEGNTFLENSIGLYAEASNRLQVSGNVFDSNGWAVKIMANAMDNAFAGNSFVGNSFDVATNSRQNFNRFNGNYWSGYRGYDLDRDGAGDVPFRPVRLFSLLVEKQPAALILLRSPFIALLDLAERALPVLTPETLVDAAPAMRPLPLTLEID